MGHHDCEVRLLLRACSLHPSFDSDGTPWRRLHAGPPGTEPLLHQDSVLRQDPLAWLRAEHVRRHQAVLQGNVRSCGREQGALLCSPGNPVRYRVPEPLRDSVVWPDGVRVGRPGRPHPGFHRRFRGGRASVVRSLFALGLRCRAGRLGVQVQVQLPRCAPYELHDD